MPTSNGMWRGRQLALISAAAALAVLALGAVFPHSYALQRLIWPCPFKAALGVPCPTCGATRVAVLLARGHIFDAVALAPIPALALLGALLLGGASVILAPGLPRRSRRDHLLDGAAPPIDRGFGRRPALIAALTLFVALYGFTLWRHAHTGLP